MINTTSYGKAKAAIAAGLLAFALVGCNAPAQTTQATDEVAAVDANGANASDETSAAADQAATTDAANSDAATVQDTSSTQGAAASTQASATTVLANASSDGMLNTADLFTERDLTQVADTSGAKSITVKSGEDVSITQEGMYVISGTATDASIVVDVDSSEKVQLVLDGLNITNESKPAISVLSADKVFVTTVAGTTNTLEVTGTFAEDGTGADAVVYSKNDLVLNGQGTLVVKSSKNGVSSHDDLKVTGGSYEITSAADALEANDNVLVADGQISITTQKDGIHAENDEDNTTGNVYVAAGTLTIDAADDGIHATTVAQVDGGTLSIKAAEAIEATYVQVNEGSLTLDASDDGINAAAKSSAYTPTIEIRGGDLSITMASGDTDALDSNGNLVVSGGNINISAQFAFDFDGTVSFTGGTVYVNGEQVTTIENTMMMGGGMHGGRGGMGGGMPGQMSDGTQPPEGFQPPEGVELPDDATNMQEQSDTTQA